MIRQSYSNYLDSLSRAKESIQEVLVLVSTSQRKLPRYSTEISFVDLKLVKAAISYSWLPSAWRMRIVLKTTFWTTEYWTRFKNNTRNLTLKCQDPLMTKTKTTVTVMTVIMISSSKLWWSKKRIQSARRTSVKLLNIKMRSKKILRRMQSDKTRKKINKNTSFPKDRNRAIRLGTILYMNKVFQILQKLHRRQSACRTKIAWILKMMWNRKIPVIRKLLKSLLIMTYKIKIKIVKSRNQTHKEKILI